MPCAASEPMSKPMQPQTSNSTPLTSNADTLLQQACAWGHHDAIHLNKLQANKVNNSSGLWMMWSAPH